MNVVATEGIRPVTQTAIIFVHATRQTPTGIKTIVRNNYKEHEANSRSVRQEISSTS
jgi:hypothetical protein